MERLTGFVASMDLCGVVEENRRYSILLDIATTKLVATSFVLLLCSFIFTRTILFPYFSCMLLLSYLTMQTELCGTEPNKRFHCFVDPSKHYRHVTLHYGALYNCMKNSFLLRTPPLRRSHVIDRDQDCMNKKSPI